MWDNIHHAYEALTRDGWEQQTVYWYRKPCGTGYVLVELDWFSFGGVQRLRPTLHVMDADGEQYPVE